MNLVPLKQLDAAVTQALARLSNGVFDAIAKGLECEMDEKVEFQFTVVVPDGINAIDRKQIQTPGKQTTVAKTDPAKEVTTVAPQISTTTATESGQSISETGQATETGTESQTKAYGKSDATNIVYEI